MKEINYIYHIAVNNEDVKKALNELNTNKRLIDVLCVELLGFIIIWEV